MVRIHIPVPLRVHLEINDLRKTEGGNKTVIQDQLHIQITKIVAESWRILHQISPGDSIQARQAQTLTNPYQQHPIFVADMGLGLETKNRLIPSVGI